jgi:hypothetical protein
VVIAARPRDDRLTRTADIDVASVFQQTRFWRSRLTPPQAESLAAWWERMHLGCAWLSLTMKREFALSCVPW